MVVILGSATGLASQPFTSLVEGEVRSMGPDQLADLLDRPEVHRKILGSYSGPYSLGVTRSHDPGNGFGFLLRVKGQNAGQFSSHVDIDGKQVPVIVKGDFNPPVPF
jgi:hypothetical protein